MTDKKNNNKTKLSCEKYNYKQTFHLK